MRHVEAIPSDSKSPKSLPGKDRMRHPLSTVRWCRHKAGPSVAVAGAGAATLINILKIRRNSLRLPGSGSTGATP
jgi:hypothetical protein